jgi:hypothetical protein
VTDADVSDKEQGNENEIESDEPKEKVTRRFPHFILGCEFLVCTSESVYVIVENRRKFYL